jgi:uncharacterized membrane protein
MRQIVLFGLVFVPSIAQADIIKCSFTEPFITTVYSTNENTLTVTYDAERRRETLKNISFQIMKPATFELWDAKRRVIQRLELSFRGSDGMSDRVFPYAAHWLSKDLHGGCTSNHLSVRP